MSAAPQRAVPVKLRHGRAVTIETLQELGTSQETHVLYCRRCNGTYSADPADYFWAKPGKAFKCCKVNNYLLRR